MTTIVIIFLVLGCLALTLWVMQIKRHLRSQSSPQPVPVPEDFLRELFAQEEETMLFLKDEVVANLSGLGFSVTGSAKQQLMEVTRGIHDYTDRRLPFDLRREGLPAAVGALVARVEERTGVTVALASQETSARYALHQEWAIYQVIEALVEQGVSSGTGGAAEGQPVELHLMCFEKHVVVRYQREGQVDERADTHRKIRVLLHLLGASSSQQTGVGWYARIPVQRLGQAPVFHGMLG